MGKLDNRLSTNSHHVNSQLTQQMRFTFPFFCLSHKPAQANIKKTTFGTLQNVQEKEGDGNTAHEYIFGICWLSEFKKDNDDLTV